MSIEAARELVGLADADPGRVASTARARLADVPEGATLDAAQAVTAWALGLALRHLRQLDEALWWLDRAIGALEPGGDDHTRAVLTLTGLLAFQGAFEKADELLTDLEPSPTMAPRVTFQRAAIAERVGDVDTAAEGYRSALTSFRESGDRLGEAHALSGLGLVAMTRGDPRVAYELYRDARRIYVALGLDMVAAVMRRNMGWAATRAGDLITAVELLETAGEELRAHGQPFIETELDYVEALMLLGRRAEATERAAAALGELQTAGASADRAELLVALGEALVTTGHAEVGERSFAVADQLFTSQGRPSWSAVVRLRRLGVMRTPSADAVAEILRLGAELRGAGLTDTAIEADVLALERARRHTRTRSTWATDPLDDRLDTCIERLRTLRPDDPRRAYGEAVHALEQGNHALACDLARRAIAEAGEAIVGATSLEVRTAMARLRDRITRVGVQAARAADDAVTLVEILRSLQRLALRPAGSRAADATGATAGRSAQPPAPSAVAAGPFVAMLDDGDDLVCVRADPQGHAFLASPDRAEVIDLLDRHHALLRDALARGASPAVARLLDRSATLVQARLPWLVGDAPLALAVSGALVEAPWTSVSARPIRTVADLEPGATASGDVTLLAGPGLESAQQEIARLRAILGDRLRVAAGSPLDAIGDAGGAIVHLCCHGHHDPVNPMLSTYELADGHLSALEIERADDVPALVVAAACRAGAARDAGLAAALGLPTAWLAAGASTVIASTCAIPDDGRTVDTVVELHRALAQGVSPEQAVWLARTRADPIVARSLSVVGRLPARRPNGPE